MAVAKAKFKEIESYAHRFAKELLMSWITSGGIKIGNYLIEKPDKDSNGFCTLEYPIIQGVFPYMHDELLGCLKRRGTCNYRTWGGSYCPCMKCPHFSKKHRLVAVADLAIAHKGAINDIIEVVYKNGLSDLKREVYERNRPIGRVLSVSAQHVLGQIQRPERLECVEAV